MTEYQPKILRLYADVLSGLAWLYMFVLGLLFCCAGAAAGFFIDASRPAATQGVMPTFLCVAGLIVGAAIGFIVSYHQRVKAQQVLCQVEVERHLALLAAAQQEQPGQGNQN